VRVLSRVGAGLSVERVFPVRFAPMLSGN